MSDTKLMPLFEDWWDNMSDHPANQVQAEPTKQAKGGPFKYLYDNGEIIIAEMNGDKYVIDIIGLEGTQPEVWKEIADSYMGVNKTYLGKDEDGMPMEEPEYDELGITSLSDVPAEHIIAYVNDLYPDNLEIGQTYDDFETGEAFVTKINDEIKADLISIFKEPELEAVL